MSLKKLQFDSVSKIVELTDCSENLLWQLANNTNKHYRTQEKPKKNSSEKRLISCPSPQLKAVQRKLNAVIVSNCDLGPYSHYGRKSRSNVTNALMHDGSKYVFTLDMKNFFPSVRPERVKQTLIQEQACSPHVATLITKLVTNDYQLPQGAPTSTTIANLVTLRLQRRLSALAVKFNLGFTILGDDITFSGDCVPDYFVKLVRKIIGEEGFKVHPSKGGVYSKSKSQMITGINVAHGITVGKQIRDWGTEYFLSKKAFENKVITRAEFIKSKNRFEGRSGYAKYVKSIKGRSKS